MQPSEQGDRPQPTTLQMENSHATTAPDATPCNGFAFLGLSCLSRTKQQSQGTYSSIGWVRMLFCTVLFYVEWGVYHGFTSLHGTCFATQYKGQARSTWCHLFPVTVRRTHPTAKNRPTVLRLHFPGGHPSHGDGSLPLHSCLWDGYTHVQDLGGIEGGNRPHNSRMCSLIKNHFQFWGLGAVPVEWSSQFHCARVPLVACRQHTPCPPPPDGYRFPVVPEIR